MTLLELALKIAMSCGFLLGQNPQGELARVAAAHLGGRGDPDADVQSVAKFRDSAVGRFFAAEMVPLLDRLVDATTRDEVEEVLEAFLDDGTADRYAAEILAFIREHQGERFLADVADMEAEGYTDLFQELDELLGSRFKRQVERGRELLLATLGDESVQDVLAASGESAGMPAMPSPLIEWLYEASVPLERRNAVLHAIRSSLCHWALGRMVHRGEVPAEPALRSLIDTWVTGLEHEVAMLRTIRDPEGLAKIEHEHQRILQAHAKLTEDPGLGGLR